MPDSCCPWPLAGGKFAGARSTVVEIPRSSSVCQNGLPSRRSLIDPEARGTTQLPTLRVLEGASARVVDRYGVIVSGSRCTKSKMPWPPGLVPVVKVDQATGLRGGTVVASG